MRDLSREHLAALAATVAMCALLVAGARRGGPAFSRPARHVLGAVILAGFAAEQIAYAERGEWSARVNLPFHLSDAVTLVSVLALWRPRPLLVELVYYWAFAATLQALATPDLRQAYPDVLYFTYFTTHGGALAAACLLVLGERRVPRAGSAPRAFAVTAGFAVVAAVATLASGGNYLFLRRKPAGGSLLDIMGPWPVYIAAAAALGLVLFLALQAAARHYPGADAQGTAPPGRRAAGGDARG
jgi:hypothetical integral membrane protein (TIGR02206 family)